MQRETVPAGNKLQLSRREGVEEISAILVKLVERKHINRGLGRAPLGLWSAVLWCRSVPSARRDARQAPAGGVGGLEGSRALLLAGRQGAEDSHLLDGRVDAGWGARDAPCGAGCSPASKSCARATRLGCRSVCPSVGPEAWPALGWSVKPWGALWGARGFSDLCLALCARTTGLSGRINSHGTNSCRAIYPKNTGDFSCSRMISHIPVAAASLIIFSQ